MPEEKKKSQATDQTINQKIAERLEYFNKLDEKEKKKTKDENNSNRK
jgi:hypothetical protein